MGAWKCFHRKDEPLHKAHFILGKIHGWYFDFELEFENFKLNLIYFGKGKSLFGECLQELNNNEIGMHFKSEISNKEFFFLDLKISVNLGGCVQMDIYRKPKATDGFLQLKSHHPPSLKRVYRWGSTWERDGTAPERRQNAEFCARGYPKKFLRKAYWRAKMTKREESLGNGRNRDSIKGQIRCIGTYDGYVMEINRILRRFWPTTSRIMVEI